MASAKANDLTVGKVLVAGAINTDLVARAAHAPGAGETVTGREFQIFGGGKGANQAVSAARSGARVAMLGAVGQDDFGRARIRDLEADGIDVRHIVRLADAPSGVALIMLEDSGENRILYVPGSTLSISAEQVEKALDDVVPTVVLATLEPPVAALDRLLSRAKIAGVPVVLNATPEPLLGRELAARCDLLVVNETEAAQLAQIEQGTATWEEVASSLRSLGPEAVVITLGEDGAVLGTAEGFERFPTPRVEVVDTTGAGDAFCGALAAQLAAQKLVRDAVQYGIAAGALAVTRAGAQPSMPTLAEIEAMLKQAAPEKS